MSHSTKQISATLQIHNTWATLPSQTKFAVDDMELPFRVVGMAFLRRSNSGVSGVSFRTTISLFTLDTL